MLYRIHWYGWHATAVRYVLPTNAKNCVSEKRNAKEKRHVEKKRRNKKVKMIIQHSQFMEQWLVVV